MLTMLFSAGALVGAAPAPPACAIAARAISVGALIVAEDILPSPCHALSKTSPLRYDRGSKALVANADIAAGTYLGRASVDVRIAPGARLTLRSSAGPVVIEREVVALQPAREGERLFVRLGDGQVVSVRFAHGSVQ